MYHTLDPQYSSLYRMHPIPNNSLAVAQLNQQGLYVSENQRADLMNGQYPADIQMKRKENAPAGCTQAAQCGGAPGCCQGWAGSYDMYGPGRACSACCAGFTPTPWSELVARPSCSSCAAPPVAPVMSDPRLGTMSSFEVQRYEAQNGYGCGGCASNWGTSVTGASGQPSMCYANDSPACCASMSSLTQRPCCSRYQGSYKGMPYPYFSQHDESGVYAGLTGYAGHYAIPAALRQAGTRSPPTASGGMEGRVVMLSPESPLVKAKDANDSAAKREADAINVARAQQEAAKAHDAALRLAQEAQAKKEEANKAASEGKVGEAAEKKQASDALTDLARQTEQGAMESQEAAIEAGKAAMNGDSEAVTKLAQKGVEAAGGALESALGALTSGGNKPPAVGTGASDVKNCYRW